MSQIKVSSVTVAFNPDAERLSLQLRALAGEVAEVIIVDNGSRVEVASLPQLAGIPVRILRLAENRGIAHGFNAGIADARARGAQYVLLLDDDSVPAAGMVGALLEGCRATRPDTRVAAAGPRIRDERDRIDYPFIQLGWIRNRHVRCSAAAGRVECDFLISSGSLVPMAAFDAVGPFDEQLFIDSVDLEWCCRARDRGLALYGVCAARLDHRLGDRRRPVMNLFELVVHSPERIYYMTRNRLLLYRRPYMPLKWKLKDVLRWIAKFSATMLLVAPRGEYLRMTVRAIRDAFAGRAGKLEAR